MKRRTDRLISSSHSEDFEGSRFGTRASGFGARGSGFGTRQTLGLRVPQGYALLILMMIVTVLLISLTAALPSIYVQAQREREEELKFRLNEYAKAIFMFRQKFQRYPRSVDELVKKTNGVRFLRHEYKDPMTKSGKWRFIHATAQGTLIDSKTMNVTAQTGVGGLGPTTLQGPGSQGAAPQGPAPLGSAPGETAQQGAPSEETGAPPPTPARLSLSRRDPTVSSSSASTPRAGTIPPSWIKSASPTRCWARSRTTAGRPRRWPSCPAARPSTPAPTPHRWPSTT